MENIWAQEEKVTGLRRRVQNWVILIYTNMLPETFSLPAWAGNGGKGGNGWKKLKVPYTYIIRMFHCILLPYLDCLLKCSSGVAKFHWLATPHCASGARIPEGCSL